MIRHNVWATRELLKGCVALSDAQWNQEFEIGPGSLRKTLTHIVGAMMRWADRISEAELRESIEDGPQRYTPEELIDLLEVASEQLGLIAADIERGAAEGAWDRRIRFDTPDGKTYLFTRAAALTHVLTHGMHHRAQALNIRRRLGLPPFGLDLDVVEWEAVQTGQLATTERDALT
ncbi:MAG: DinB family protein [Phycisphaerales bacterium]